MQLPILSTKKDEFSRAAIIVIHIVFSEKIGFLTAIAFISQKLHVFYKYRNTS